MKYLSGFISLLLTTLAWAEPPCERTINMESAQVLETLSLDPLRGVTLKFPFALKNDETLYAISDTEIVKLNQANNTNIVVLQSLKFGEEVIGRKIDLTIANHAYSFILTLVIESKPNNRYCSLVSFEMSDALLAKINEKASSQQQHKTLIAQQKAEIESLARNKAFEFFAQWVDIKPDKKRINKKVIEKIPDQGRIIARVDKIETYDAIHVIRGRVINDTKEDLTVKSIQLDTEAYVSSASDAANIKHEVIKAGKASAYTLTTNAVLNQGAEVTVNTSQGSLKVNWL